MKRLSREEQMRRCSEAIANAMRPHGPEELTAADRVLSIHEEQQRRQASLALEPKGEGN